MNPVEENTSRSNWDTLLKSISNAASSSTDDINKAKVIQALSQYMSKEEDWRKYTYFDERFYTRNLVDVGNGKYNVMILAWNPAQGTCIHDHSNSNCFVKVLAGALREIRYEIPEEGKNFNLIGDYVRERDEVSYMDNTIGVHEIKNDTANQAVTLHVYIPPFDTCKSFNRDTAASSVCGMKFKSIYGEVIQENSSSEQSSGYKPCC